MELLRRLPAAWCPREAERRVLLIDFDNMVGSVSPREQVVRQRVAAIRDAAGPVHHAVAAYAVRQEALMSPGEPTGSSPQGWRGLATGPSRTASVLAEMGVAALPVVEGRNAADHALLAHAWRVRQSLQGCVFLVASADHRFAELEAAGPIDVLVWADQRVARKLDRAAREVRRIAPVHVVARPELATAPSNADNGFAELRHRTWAHAWLLSQKVTTALARRADQHRTRTRSPGTRTHG